MGKTKGAKPGGRAGDEALFADARALLRAGRFDQARRACQGLLKRNPGHPALLELQGLIALQQGRHEDAVAALRKAVSAAPPSAGLFNNLSLALASAGQAEAAVEAARRASAAKPEVAEFQVNLGNRLRAAGHIDEAIEAYRQALAARPDFTTAHVSLGNTWASIGAGDQARQHYKLALEQQPNHIKAFYHLALSSKSGENALDPATLARFRSLAEDGPPSGEEAVLLHSALGFLDDLEGEHDRAFEHVRRSNEAAKAELLRRKQPYDRAAHSRRVGRIIDAFSAARLGSDRRAPSGSRRPIFVLGMPRSGTTLVEQILCAHRDVAAAGEIPLLGELAEKISRYPSGLWRLSDPALKKIARTYLSELERLDTESAFVTDKMPQNFLHIGLIAILFPKARIVHCRRDPVDTCLSCYFQNFTHGNAFARDLGDIGAYYGDYRRLMDHWMGIASLGIVEVGYEELAADPEPATRRLLADLGLDWDENCLSHERSRRPIATASQWQVRRKIHGKAVGRWRSYRDHLGPLLDALGPLAE